MRETVWWLVMVMSAMTLGLTVVAIVCECVR